MHVSSPQTLSGNNREDPLSFVPVKTSWILFKCILSPVVVFAGSKINCVLKMASFFSFFKYSEFICFIPHFLLFSFPFTASLWNLLCHYLFSFLSLSQSHSQSRVSRSEENRLQTNSISQSTKSLSVKTPPPVIKSKHTHTGWKWLELADLRAQL